MDSATGSLFMFVVAVTLIVACVLLMNALLNMSSDELKQNVAAWAPLIGLGGLGVGALMNSELNRRRDNELRALETGAIAGALSGELGVAVATMDQILTVSEGNPLPPTDDEINSFVEYIFTTMRQPFLYEVYGKLVDKIGNLQKEDARMLVGIYAYRRSVFGPPHDIPGIATTARQRYDQIRAALKLHKGACEEIQAKLADY